MIIHSLFWLTYFRLGLWVCPSVVTKRAITDADNGAMLPGQEIDKEMLSKIVRTIRRCSRYVPFASCLTQALAAKRILRSYGQTSKVKIGVATKDSTIEAHAWLEVADKIVLGRVAEQGRFSVMTSRPQVLQ
ncbi:MAG: lasso peptide biosynthesis B2 protein [Pyrinomonadaceae bacterium]|nr:lasso peptide biosynthesis B2 protein [Pyrinomonadaceae bacterium]